MLRSALMAAESIADGQRAHHCVALLNERGHHSEQVRRVGRAELHFVERAVRIELRAHEPHVQYSSDLLLS